jgi:hypothetical protein
VGKQLSAGLLLLLFLEQLQQCGFILGQETQTILPAITHKSA